MIGKRYGKLVIASKYSSENGVKWLCKCDCGKERVSSTSHLNAGYVKSCGCHVKKAHALALNGGKHSRERISYDNMVARCMNPKNKRYKDYGAAGITVCDSWLESFDNFANDMGACPDGFQIDRIDNTKGYSKENCRWTDRKTNMNNRRNSGFYYIKGLFYESPAVAAKALGVCEHTVNAWCKGRLVGDKFYPPKIDCFHVFKYQ